MRKAIHHRVRQPGVAALLACFGLPALAAESTLPTVSVEGERSIAERRDLPHTVESVTAPELAQRVNAMTAEDAVKYLPSVLVRRRFIGDTQAPLATRTTGINAGARTLIYVDGILLSTLINNNNQNGSPQWFMVSPEEIARADMLYGPFAAAYPGNSYGGVLNIETRMPKAFEAGAGISSSLQRFSQYGTDNDYPATQTHAYLGNRHGALSWRLTLDHLNAFSQPLTYLTLKPSGAAVPGAPTVAGGYADRDRSGAPILVAGAGNLTHTVQDSAKLRLAYDVTPSLTAAYTLGYWRNDATATPQSYLSANGAPYYGGSGNAAIGGNAYSAPAIGKLFSANTVQQERWMQGLTLKSRRDGPWNWEVAATSFRYRDDLTRTSTGAFPAAAVGGPGTIADASGTGWNTWDAIGHWKAPHGAHRVSFGAHLDRYALASPVYNTADWIAGANGTPNADSRGATRTTALWAQDAWRIAPTLTATVGARQEWWRAYDGYNLSTTSNASFPVNQPEQSRSAFSPKLSLSWQANTLWNLTGSFGRAVRFPTVGELYQNISTGTTFTQADPNLRPETVLSGELALTRETESGRLRASLFQERVSDALISQTSTLPGYPLPVSFVQNVDRTRQRGIEVAGNWRDLPLRGLELGGSITYVNATILENGSYVPSAPGATSVGKRTPYVPKWRATALATWRPDERWAWTVAARYSSRQYATVDNTDINPATYQGFEGYAVIDTRVQYRVDAHWQLAAGIDNLNNRSYFLFHPFPERTLYAEAKYAY
ncbi:TonB-dependent receptor [Noviherbaspirillum pedocola]|uniref:TonB-dependent receptor n=1 Tax=Noviherbaspirillum pedocola TaxID=2801341 RepID=A0A934T1H4_9BURK|nr:TonB-dependent receptor [Noviherbaspirillum pedocola]MBK4735803.1 TonB-dependent receptor [Noviherbaspirillum pedocola]